MATQTEQDAYVRNFVQRFDSYVKGLDKLCQDAEREKKKWESSSMAHIVRGKIDKFRKNINSFGL